MYIIQSAVARLDTESKERILVGEALALWGPS
jgi:hypothetical protein